MRRSFIFLAMVLALAGATSWLWKRTSRRTTSKGPREEELLGKWTGQHVVEGRFTDGGKGRFRSVIDATFEVNRGEDGLTAVYADKSVITSADGTGEFTEEWRLTLDLARNAQQLTGAVKSASYRNNGRRWVNASAKSVSFEASLGNESEMSYEIVLKRSRDGRELTGRRGTFRRSAGR